MKKSLIISALVASMFTAPVTAKADYCGACVAATIKAEASNIAKTAWAQASLMAELVATKLAVIDSMLMASSQMHADMERQNTMNKAIAEAAQDHDKQYRFQENAANVKSQTEVPNDSCRVMATGSALGTAIQDEREVVQDLITASTKRNLNTYNQAATVAATIKTHEDNFCSAEEAAKGRCTQATGNLQNADLVASNLFKPNATLMYTDKESLAAKSYIQNLVNPFPTQGIPANWEKTPQGKAFVAAQMDEQRKLSIAEFSLSKIYASRESVPGLGSKAMMPTQDASIMSVIEYHASRFLNPEKQIEIAKTASSEMLLKELVNTMSFRAWMDFKGYEQNERIEALLASTLALQAKENSSRVLNAQRAALVAPTK